MDHQLKEFAPYVRARDVDNKWQVYEVRAWLSLIGCPLLLLGALAAMVVIILLSRNRLLIGIASSLIFLSVLGAYALLFSFSYHRNLSRRHRLDSARTLCEDQRPPVLYLRPFTEDPRELKINVEKEHIAPRALKSLRRNPEELLVKALSDIGPVVAVGVPGENLPPLGAVRLYFAHSEWQEKVLTLASISRLVVIQAGAGPGVEWEMENMLRLQTPDRVLFSFISWMRKKWESRQIDFEIFCSAYGRVMQKITRDPDDQIEQNLSKPSLNVTMPQSIAEAIFMEIDDPSKPRLAQLAWWKEFFLMLQPAARIRETLVPILKNRKIAYRKSLFQAGALRALLLASVLVLAFRACS